MKIVFVVDSALDLQHKIELIKNNFGSDINFVVKAQLVPLFQTFGYSANAVYNNNLARVIHMLLLRAEVSDVLVYYSSMIIDNDLLTKFRNKMTGNKVVSVMPEYNPFETMSNSIYNCYVKSMFKAKDSLTSPKLQYLPQPFVIELLASHFGNKLFELNPSVVSYVRTENKEINKSLKVKPNNLKISLISLIVALAITMLLIISLAFLKPHFLLITLFVCLYIVDIFLAIILSCKDKFDTRFLK